MLSELELELCYLKYFLNGKKFMKLNLDLLLCWIGIHRYKVIDVSFGFGPAGSVKTVQCKICGIKKTRKG